MSAPRFDASEAVTFDLAFGHVHLDGAPHRVLVPADALVALCRDAGEEAAAELAQAMGRAMGRRVSVRLAPPSSGSDRLGAVRAADFEAVVEHLAGELAIAGVGALGAERWGRALVLTHDQSPLGEEGDGFMAELLQAALFVLGNQPLRVVHLVREGGRARFLIVSAAAVESVRERLGRGDSWSAVVAALQAPVS